MTEEQLTMNRIARLVTQLEGKKLSLSIAQVKEVLKCLQSICEVDAVRWEVHNYLRPSGNYSMERLKKEIALMPMPPKPKPNWVSAKAAGLYDPKAASKKAIVHKRRAAGGNRKGKG